MKNEAPEGWDAPINRGLLAYDELFGAPRLMMAITLPLIALAFLWPWSDLVALAIMIHTVAVGITKLEPEWITIIVDLCRTSGEYEP